MAKKSYFEQQIVALPVGLQRCVLRIIASCVGQDKAIERANLLSLVQENPGLAKATDRQVRKAIENLRGEGYLICNILDGDGYYLASSAQEYQTFRSKYGSYAFTIMERIRAMDKEADARWGEAQRRQMNLL